MEAVIKVQKGEKRCVCGLEKMDRNIDCLYIMGRNRQGGRVSVHTRTVNEIGVDRGDCTERDWQGKK